jgi:hypothetical protein
MYRNFLKAFLNILLRSACFTDEAFLVKSKTSVLGTTHFKCLVMRISKLSDIGLKEFCCTCLPELEIHTQSCSRTLGYFMMDISDQNIESDRMIMSSSVCKNLKAVLTYSEVLPQN